MHLKLKKTNKVNITEVDCMIALKFIDDRPESFHGNMEVLYTGERMHL